MSVGRSISQAELNSTWGGLSASLHAVMANILEAKAVLDGYAAADLVSAFGFVLADANTLKSAATDMATLAAVFQGQVAQTPAYDFRTFAKRLLGTGLY